MWRREIVRGLIVLTVVGGATRAAEPVEPSPTSPPGPRSQVGVLTLEAARKRALEVHPSLTRLHAQVRAQEARADQIGTALVPTVSGQVDASVGASPPKDFADTPDVTVRAGIVGSWTITDFGRTGAAERASRIAAQADETAIAASERDILVAVDEAFFNAKAQAELVAVAQANLAAETRHREEAERFVAAGTRAAIEVARARTQEARAKTELVRAETAVRQALVGLGQAMGLTVTPAGVSGEWSVLLEDETSEATVLSQRAYETRAEVVAQRRQVEAAEAAVLAAERGNTPFITADAQVGVGSVGLEEWSPSWQVGLTFTWPFYDGGRSHYAAAAARADLEAATIVLSELEVGIAAEVSSSSEAVVSAKAEIAAAQAVREAAEVELHLAEERWKEGLGSGIELADAQTRLAVASADRTRAELSLALARARLARALGR